MATNFEARGTLAGVDVQVLEMQTVERPKRFPKLLKVTCTVCGATWTASVDRGEVARRNDTTKKRRSWRGCPNDCNTNRLTH